MILKDERNTYRVGLLTIKVSERRRRRHGKIQESSYNDLNDEQTINMNRKFCLNTVYSYKVRLKEHEHPVCFK